MVQGRTVEIRIVVREPSGDYSSRDIATHELKVPATLDPKRITSHVYDALVMLNNQIEDMTPAAPIESESTIA